MNQVAIGAGVGAGQGAARSVTVCEGDRLVMYRASADNAAFWEAHWRANPPVEAKGQRINHWLREHAAKLPKDGLIIEAGCGNGNVLRTFTGEGFEVEGLDFASAAVEANRALDPAGRYRVGDVRALPYEDGSLGGYISLGVVEHFDDVTRAGILRECARCLRPGGVAIIATPCFNGLRKMRAAMGLFDEPRVAEGMEFYQYLFTREELAEQVRGAGLEVIATDGYDVYKGIKDTLGGRAVLDWVRGLGKRPARWVHHPAKALRLLCGHMGVVVGRKADSTLTR